MELRWDDSYNIGVPQIDEQHKRLFAIIDELTIALRQGKGTQIIANTFARLADYTHYHFESEEFIMQRYNYPRIDEHKTMHVEFKRSLAILISRWQDGEMMVNVDTYNTLRDWIREHVTSHTRNADQSLGIFIRLHPDGVNTHRAPEDNDPEA
ncbi:bacteriohemerythrin [bacterium]|nr:bacteriohemerythrin [bacterium]